MGTTPSNILILDDVELRMGNITVANGYHTDLKKIERARMKVWNGYDLPAINYWATTVLNEEEAYETDKRELRLFIEYHSKTKDDPFVDVAEKLAADVVTAMNRLPVDTAGKSVGRDSPHTDMSGISSTKFQISADGDAAEEVTCDWSGKTTGDLVAAEMESKIQALGGNKASVTVSYSNVRYVILSGMTGASSAIVITPGSTLDCTGQLGLGASAAGLEYAGLAAAPKVSDLVNPDLNWTVKKVKFDGYDYEIGTGQEPWCGVLTKWGVEYLAPPNDMFNYYRE